MGQSKSNVTQTQDIDLSQFQYMCDIIFGCDSVSHDWNVEEPKPQQLKKMFLANIVLNHCVLALW